jgi:hypothetical protein
MFSQVSAIAFTGSRHSSPELSAAFNVIAALVPSGLPVSVGCAAGLDALVRGYFPSSRLRVFAVAERSQRWSFAQRSIACMLSVPSGAEGLVIALAGQPCPVGVKPSRQFQGQGSGTWGSVAYALGHGRRVLVCVHVPPCWVKVIWSSAPGLPAGWWLGEPAQSQDSQLSLL